MIEVLLEGGTEEKPNSLLANSNIRGVFNADAQGTGLTLSVLDGEKVVAVSSIRLSSDGTKLLGSTTTGSSAQHGSLRYDWEAVRH
jgi:hypothetical protein